MHNSATALAVMAALLAAPAMAEDGEGLYLGVGLGDYSADVDGLEDVDDADLDFDSDAGARKFFGGWRLNRFVGVQLEYTDFGELDSSVGALDLTASADGITPSIVGTLPLGPVELYGKAGVMFYDVEIDGGGVRFLDHSGENTVIGTGIGLTLLERLNLRLEYERTDLDELEDADSVWLTGAWRF